MIGSIKQRYKGSWTIRVDLGRKLDPKTGLLKRKQKSITIKGTRREAEQKQAELINQIGKRQFVEPSKKSFGAWLDTWVEAAIKPNRRLRTYETYESVIRKHLKPSMGSIPLQELRVTDIQSYYAESKLSAATLDQHHTVLHSALKAAQQQELIDRNPATLVMNKPRKQEDYQNVRHNCWELSDARTFLAYANTRSAQVSAFYTMAIETGMRRGELCGLKWENVDLASGKVSVVEQLIKVGPNPIFGDTKNGRPRTITINPETVALLRAHRSLQLETKLENRAYYHDYGLVFAKDWREVTRRYDTLGDPIQMNSIGKQFDKLIAAAGVNRITFHGLRHTCATLLLQAEAPIHVVSERLGHRAIGITLEIYAHVLPSMQKDAADRLRGLLHA
jgi:integrase